MKKAFLRALRLSTGALTIGALYAGIGALGLYAYGATPNQRFVIAVMQLGMFFGALLTVGWATKPR